jgi:16S rRNA A1518/A1519 N6-dimethyltransferase RsmA/KsgA/DIM1 with predicted DNA glycosylase/AP lyase activity
LRSQLAIAFQPEVSKPQVDELLARLKIDPQARAEQLSVEQIIELLESARALRVA